MMVDKYRYYIKCDEWSSRDFTHKRNDSLNKNVKINFSSVPNNFKPLIKLYIYSSLNKNTFLTCKSKLRKIIPFIVYINKINLDATDFRFLEAKHIIDFIDYLKGQNLEYETKNQKILSEVRNMISTLQKIYPEYVSSLDIEFILKRSNRIFKSDLGKENKVKCIPEDIIIQFDEKIKNINNKTDLIIAKCMRATGWRCNEIFRLKYDTAIIKDEDKYYIVLEHVSKTRVLEKYLPIGIELAKEIQELANEVSSISNNENNPNRYLFIYTKGRYKHKRIGYESFISRLNKWAKINNIRDKCGNIYKFSSHMFRHTIASEFINSKMELEVIKTFLSHKSENMTLEYANINMMTIKSEYSLIYQSLYNLVENLETHISIVEDIIEVSNNMVVSKKKLGYCIKPQLLKCNIYNNNKCNNCKNYEDNINTNS